MPKLTKQYLTHVRDDLTNVDDLEVVFVPDEDSGGGWVEVDVSQLPEGMGVLRISAEDFTEFGNLVEYLSKQ